MKLFASIVAFLIISYVSFTFIQVLLKMRKNIILPTNEQEAFRIRKHPEKPVDLPTYSGQKVSIIFYSTILLIVIAMFLASIFFQLFWFQSLLLLPILLLAYNLINILAIMEDGILIGSRFVPWKRIKSFTFIPIDMSHKHYGFSKEANEGYELEITTTSSPISFVVIDDNTKERLKNILNEHVSNQV